MKKPNGREGLPLAASDIEQRPVEVGKTYIINADSVVCRGTVVVVACHGPLFCRVKNPDTGYEWETMCYRLSEPPPTPQTP